MSKDFRDHAWHWGSYVDSRTRPKTINRFPLWRDMILAIITGLLLGSSLVFTFIEGFFPPAGVLGLFILSLHVLVLSLGQYVDEARLEVSNFQRIGRVGAAAMVASALVTLTVMV